MDRFFKQPAAERHLERENVLLVKTTTDGALGHERPNQQACTDQQCQGKRQFGNNENRMDQSEQFCGRVKAIEKIAIGIFELFGSGTGCIDITNGGALDFERGHDNSH